MIRLGMIATGAKDLSQTMKSGIQRMPTTIMAIMLATNLVLDTGYDGYRGTHGLTSHREQS